MKSKLNYLIGMSLKRKMGSKWFKIINILLFIVLVAVANIDSIISMFGGDFNKKQVINVIDNTNVSYEVFKGQMLNATNTKEDEDFSYDIKLYEESEDTIEKYLENKDTKDDIFIVFNPSEENTLDIKVISQAYINTMDYSYIQNAIYNTKVGLAIQSSDVDMDKLNKIYEKAKIERIIYDENKSSTSENENMIMTTVFPIIILPFFILVIYLVQMVGAEINDEKTTKGMEIIISSVSPNTHLFSKIIAGNLFVIVQAALLFVYGLVGFKIRSMIGGNDITGGVMSYMSEMIDSMKHTELMTKFVYIIPLTIVLMVLTFVMYSVLAGVLASMTTNNEDFQQIQTPIMMVLFVGYYLAVLAGTFNGSLLIKILSYIPFISAILAPSLLVIGDIGVIDILIAILVSVGTIFVLIKYGLRIYKAGILNYSSSNLWKKIGKALKTK